MISDMAAATLYGFCLSQAPLMLTLVLYFKEPSVTVFTAVVTNTTDVWVDSNEYGMSMGFVLGAVFVLVFGLVTSQLKERGVVSNMQAYDEETMHELTMWTAVMWLVFAVSHVLLTARALKVADLYLLCLTVGGQLNCLTRICGPVSRLQSLWLALYLGLCGLVWGAVEHGFHSGLWVLMVLFDLLLVLRHVHDSSPNMQTVTNCRVVFCVAMSALLLISYCGR